VRALSNALAQGRLHHAYLFTGTRGVGKTTLARILAKCLNCTHDEHPTAEPCGVCPACTEIDGGRFIDLIEIDAASNTGIDNMRDVIENAQYAPTSGRYKVYIIDEVHMLSKNAFNAMLKTLEEPPGHVIFILATTDPQKVPVTVLSRCLQFNLKQMPPGHISGHLKNVLEAESIPFEAGALSLIARAAAGSMRDALSLTDQAIAYCTGEVKEAETRAMLGVIDQAYLMPILEALAAQDGPRLMAEAAELAARGFSFDAALQDMAAVLHQIALAQSVPEAVSEDTPERERLFQLASQLDPESVQLHYQIATLGRRDLEWAPDEYAGFSMTLLRMLAFMPSNAPGNAAGDGPAARAPVHTGSSATVAPLAATTKTPPRPAAAALNALNSSSPARPSIAIASAANEPLPVASADRATSKTAFAVIASDWRSLAESLPGLVRQLAMQCEQIERSATVLRLALPESQNALLASVGDKLRAALAEKLGAAIKIEINLTADTRQSPAAERAREQAVRQSEAEQAIHDDPNVQLLVRECDATLTHIRPRSAAAS